MNKHLAAGILALLILLSAGCGDSAAYRQALPQPTYPIPGPGSASPQAPAAPAEKPPLSGHLTIKSYWDPLLDLCVQDFIDLHPGVTIDLIQSNKDGLLPFDDYHTQTAVELMSGGGADIVDVASFAVFKYAKSGVFCDLYPLMDADPDFCREDYYTNIFRAKEYQGSLYSMPCGFSYNLLYLSRPLLKEAALPLPASLNYREMLALQQQVASATGTTPGLLPGLDPYSFFWYECPEYYDTDSRTARFSHPAFADYLRLTKTLIPPDGDTGFTRLGYDDSFLRQDYLFCRFDVSGGDDLCNFLFDFPNIAGPVPMVSSSGRAPFRTMREYAITSSSPNRALAWEFLKFCVGERQPPESIDSPDAKRYLLSYNAFVPINKANFFSSFRFAFQYHLPYFEKDPAVRWREGDREEMIREALELLHRYNQQRDTPEAEGEIYGLLCEDLNSCYYLDLLTPEETAERLQNRMTIFLRE